MKLWKKQMRVRMALILCVAMSLSIIGLPGQEPAAQAEQVAQIREPEYPTGGLQEIDVYEVAGEEAEQVPSYENQITLFRRSSSIPAKFSPLRNSGVYESHLWIYAF